MGDNLHGADFPLDGNGMHEGINGFGGIRLNVGKKIIFCVRHKSEREGRDLSYWERKLGTCTGSFNFSPVFFSSLDVKVQGAVCQW